MTGRTEAVDNALKAREEVQSDLIVALAKHYSQLPTEIKRAYEALSKANWAVLNAARS